MKCCQESNLLRPSLRPNQALWLLVQGCTFLWEDTTGRVSSFGSWAPQDFWLQVWDQPLFQRDFLNPQEQSICPLMSELPQHKHTTPHPNEWEDLCFHHNIWFGPNEAWEKFIFTIYHCNQSKHMSIITTWAQQFSPINQSKEHKNKAAWCLCPAPFFLAYIHYHDGLKTKCCEKILWMWRRVCGNPYFSFQVKRFWCSRLPLTLTSDRVSTH